MKLHLGCGDRVIPGWTGVDLHGIVADLCEDVRYLPSIPDESCEVIYACHVLDHLSRKDCEPTLSLWWRKLVLGGTLRIAVSDFNAIACAYDAWEPLENLLGLLIGGQKGPDDYHQNVFDGDLLSNALTRCGYRDVKRWDWRETEHSHIDDFSQAYLPHMDKEKGRLMSLNMEGTK